MGEGQLILGANWVMGIQRVADPARAGLFLDSALYVPTEAKSGGLAPAFNEADPGGGRGR